MIVLSCSELSVLRPKYHIRDLLNTSLIALALDPVVLEQARGLFVQKLARSNLSEHVDDLHVCDLRCLRMFNHVDHGPRRGWRQDALEHRTVLK